MISLSKQAARTGLAWLFMAAGIGLLVWNLDDAPVVTLILALATFGAAASLMSRPAR